MVAYWFSQSGRIGHQIMTQTVSKRAWMCKCIAVLVATTALLAAARPALAASDMSYTLRISEDLNVLKNPNVQHAKSMAA